jgi:DNA-binding transcriptional ArsR family regulator
MKEDRHLDNVFAALADATRRAILLRLATQGEASVMELAEPFAMTQPAVSRHLKVLEKAGLISRGREAQRRPCRLRAQPLGDAATWLENYRQFWESRYRSLDALLDELKVAATTDATDSLNRKQQRTDTHVSATVPESRTKRRSRDRHDS